MDRVNTYSRLSRFIHIVSLFSALTYIQDENYLDDVDIDEITKLSLKRKRREIKGTSKN